MSTTDGVEDEQLLEGQRVFNGPRKLGSILFGNSTSEQDE
jgi:hypothetical protein